jgi:CRISPR/Cas system type I-B associated protein Csh2 (Cas7 group RAMP superfamily)
MIYKRRNLQQLWEVIAYTGDRDAKKPKTEKLTVIAWNDVDVARKIGDRLAKMPKSLGHVWQDPSTDEYHLIENTESPPGKTVRASTV